MTGPRLIRGGKDLCGGAAGNEGAMTAPFAAALGQSYALWLKNREGQASFVAVCHDGGAAGRELEQACAEGICRAGLNAELFGACPAPALYALLLEQPRLSAAVAISSGSTPEVFDGYRLFLPSGVLPMAAHQEVLRLTDALPAPAESQGKAGRGDWHPALASRLRSLAEGWLKTCVARPLLGLRAVVEGESPAGNFLKEMLVGLGAEVHTSRPFPQKKGAPRPDPVLPEALAALGEGVRGHRADLGVLVSPDGSYARFAGQDGQALGRNRMIALIAAFLLDREANLTILTDSVTSSGLTGFIGEWGGEHYRFRCGFHAAVEEARRLNLSGINCPAVLGTGGAAAFRDNGFTEDGLYLALFAACEALRLKREGRGLLSLLNGLKEPAESVELRLEILSEAFREAGIRLIERVMDHASHTGGWHLALDNREGVRISFDLDRGRENAWFLLRLSLQEPVLVLNAESDVPGGVALILNKFHGLLGEDAQVDLGPVADMLAEPG